MFKKKSPKTFSKMSLFVFKCGFSLMAEDRPKSSWQSPVFPIILAKNFFLVKSQNFVILSGKLDSPPPKKKKKLKGATIGRPQLNGVPRSRVFSFSLEKGKRGYRTVKTQEFATGFEQSKKKKTFSPLRNLKWKTSLYSSRGYYFPRLMKTWGI